MRKNVDTFCRVFYHIFDTFEIYVDLKDIFNLFDQ